MKKLLFITISLLGVLSVIGGCSNNDIDGNFDYPLEKLYGKWKVTHVERENGSMIDITALNITPTYATFSKDGTYYGSGYLGNGSGTYKTKGKTIICYIDGIEYLKYDVLSFSGNQCELKMYAKDNSKSIRIRCRKQ